MEAAMESGKHLIVLDRPNPNGHYIDGPVLEKPFQSFVGMQAVPVVYGMTIGEYAQMLYGEQWLDPKAYSWGKGSGTFELTIIPCNNYTHKTFYNLPVKPSPNLPDMQSVYLYPTTCFFEGTLLSEGRGTDKPFQVYGHPSYSKSMFSFTPKSREGAKKPKLQDQVCYGWDHSGTPDEVRNRVANKLQIGWILEAYNLFPDKSQFFMQSQGTKKENVFFNKLAGNSTLMQQIKEEESEEIIRKSWEPALSQFKNIRKKYLLYPDFE
jgi:uncharacterized protein YbbC (DUF1343 family)